MAATVSENMDTPSHVQKEELILKKIIKNSK
jgi:hypothetical protein